MAGDPALLFLPYVHLGVVVVHGLMLGLGIRSNRENMRNRTAQFAVFLLIVLGPRMAAPQSARAQDIVLDQAPAESTLAPADDSASEESSTIFAPYTRFLGWGRTALAGGSDLGTGSTSWLGSMALAIPAAQSTASPTEKAGSGPSRIWNLHVQNTDVFQGYPSFSAQYSGPQSLPTSSEGRETVSLDVMAGVRLWSGAEGHIDGLMWQGFGINNVLGIEGFPSGEAYRIGTKVPNGTFARFFIRQTIGLGGAQEDVADDQFTLPGKQDISRLTITLGRISAADIFDTNAYANDARTQFMNRSFVKKNAWDYPADVIGYDTGLAVELNQPKWTLRYGFFQVPSMQNSFTEDDQIFTWPHNSSGHDGPFFRSWAMVWEFERRYSSKTHPGAIRFLAYVNRANMFSYSGAIPILRGQRRGSGSLPRRALTAPNTALG